MELTHGVPMRLVAGRNVVDHSSEQLGAVCDLERHILRDGEEVRRPLSFEELHFRLPLLALRS